MSEKEFKTKNGTPPPPEPPMPTPIMLHETFSTVKEVKKEKKSKD